MKKKILIAAGAAVFLLIVLVVVLLVCGKKRSIENMDQDSRYPYTLKNSKKGIVVTINGLEEGYDWYSTVSNVLAVYPTKTGSDKNDVRKFLLRPTGFGNAEVDFTLKNPEEAYDQLYQIRVLVRSDDGKVSYLGSSHAELAGILRSPDGRYTIAQVSDTSYQVCMLAALDAEWTASSEGGVSAVIQSNAEAVTDYYTMWTETLDTEQEATGKSEEPSDYDTEPSMTPDTYFLVSCPLSPADGSVTILDRVNQEALELQFTYVAGQGLVLTAHEMVSVQEQTSAEAEWGFPEDLHIENQEVSSYTSQVTGEVGQVDELLLTGIGSYWFYYRSDTFDRDDLAKQYFDGNPEEEAPTGDTQTEDTEDAFTPVETDGIWYFMVDGHYSAAWDHNGYGCLMLGQTNFPLEELQSLVRVMAGVEQ